MSNLKNTPESGPVRTIGELSVSELLASASSECSGMNSALERASLTREDRIILGAYLGSIWSRIGVARDKIGG